MYQTDNFERQKPFMPKAKDVVGTSPIIPTMDTDEKLMWYDTQGESLYSNPVDPNSPVIDHGLDEDKIWAFRMTAYNQDQIKNEWALDLNEAKKSSHAPWWGLKLATPAFSKDSKLPTFFRQWQSRLELELLKSRHAIELAQAKQTSDPKTRQRMKEEV